MSQQYSLRWNNHQPNFISMFTTLLNTQTLVDVTLAAEGKHLQAHKVVLSACSTYFQALFIDNPSRHPIVILKDVSFVDLRTMVDFMYYGEVNVTEEQLPQVLDTAKLLKIKGLTEMPDSASLTRAPGAGDFPITDERLSASPVASPNTKRKRRRKSSSGSQQLNVCEEARAEDAPAVGLVRADAITLSSLPRRRDLFDERHHGPHQTNEQHNLNVDPMSMDGNSAGMPQESSSSSGVQQHRRSKLFKRQSHVEDAAPERPRRQASEPTPVSPPPLHKHHSYPQYSHKHRRERAHEQEVGSLVVRAVESPQRASHTPAVRSGPPLSCNFCWNTVDECGRILRRKTQYHCPECRTNLCIVPCFHEYHDGADAGADASAT